MAMFTVDTAWEGVGNKMSSPPDILVQWEAGHKFPPD